MDARKLYESWQMTSLPGAMPKHWADLPPEVRLRWADFAKQVHIVQEATRTQDTVRVLRIIEYVGPRAGVEALVSKSIQGMKVVGSENVTIRAATIGTYPEILEATP